MRALLAVALSLSLTACSSLGLAMPQTPSQVYAVTEVSLTQVVNMAIAAKQAGLMSPAVTQQVDRGIQLASALVHDARKFLAAGDATSALTALNNAETAIASAKAVIPSTGVAK